MIITLLPVVLIGFIFVCIAMPQLVKSKLPFMGAIALMILAILLGIIQTIFRDSFRFGHVMDIIIGILDLAAFVALILATGGMTLQQLGGEFASSYKQAAASMQSGQKTDVTPMAPPAPSQQPPTTPTV